LTGRPHQPMNAENANPGPPNDFPSLGAVVQRLQPKRQGLPAAITLPMRIFNTDGSVWPGQDAGFLGRAADPWLVRCNPATADFRVAGLELPADVPPIRLDGRRSLLENLNIHLDALERNGIPEQFDRQTQQAFDLLRSGRSRRAFRLDQEAPLVRDRY